MGRLLYHLYTNFHEYSEILVYDDFGGFQTVWQFGQLHLHEEKRRLVEEAMAIG